MKCDICGKEVPMTDAFTGYQINFCSQCQMHKDFRTLIKIINDNFEIYRDVMIKSVIKTIKRLEVLDDTE